jgi:ribose transport system permease protein
MFVLARGSGSSPGTEDNLLLEMVLATFLGAAFSPRRKVTIWGAALGAVLVTMLSVGFKSIGVNVFWTGCIKGSLILIVVASAAATARGRY